MILSFTFSTDLAISWTLLWWVSSATSLTVKQLFLLLLFHFTHSASLHLLRYCSYSWTVTSTHLCVFIKCFGMLKSYLTGMTYPSFMVSSVSLKNLSLIFFSIDAKHNLFTNHSLATVQNCMFLLSTLNPLRNCQKSLPVAADEYEKHTFQKSHSFSASSVNQTSLLPRHICLYLHPIQTRAC